MALTTSRRRAGIALTLAAVLAVTVAAVASVPAGAREAGNPPPHDHGSGAAPPQDGGTDTPFFSDHGAALTGAAEVPGPGDPDGAGLAHVVLDPDAGRACLGLEVADIAAATAAHIHEGPAGVAGPIVVDFTSTLSGEDCVDGVDSALLERIRANPAAFYVNVHNARFPAGAIRGQVFEKTTLADEVVLPAGFQPEGVAVAEDGTFYVGSLARGAIYRGDLNTGLGEILVEPVDGRVAVGVEYDDGRLWVAGGATGQARAYDAHSGELLGSWSLASAPTFINDVVVAGDTAWFTDSMKPVLYGVRLGQDEVTVLPLSGELQFTEGFNTNGIEATDDGATLVVVQSNTASLFTVDPTTGVTARIDLGADDVTNGDGLLFEGGFLYVVQNRLNQIARIQLADDLSSGTVVARLTDPDLNVPTTVGAYAGRLWAVNARFGTTPTPETFYSVVSVRG